MVERIKNYIGGEWVESKSDDNIEVKNPALDETIALHPKATQEEVDEAVKAAKEAFPKWRNTTPVQRAKLMFKFREELEKNKKELAEILVKEHGKTLLDAEGEIIRTFENIEYTCGVPELSKGTFCESVGTGVDAYYILEPLGVFLLLPPFNFPAMITSFFCWHISMGNTIVIKPPDQCPMTVQKLMEITQKCNFLAGVINMVCGSADVGKQLVKHPDVKGVTFVGSSTVGKIVYRDATSEGKRAQVQAGAKNHIVINDDCNLATNMDGLVNAAFGSTSQRCFAASNFLVHEKMYDEFVDIFVSTAKKLKVGYGLEPDVDMGPLVSRKSLNMALEYVEKAKKDGAEIILDGSEPRVEKYPNGYFMAPTILLAEPEMRVWKEEIFAPVRCVRKFSKISEAIDIINKSEYGHSAAIFTERGGIAREFCHRVNTGHVGINVATPVPLSYMSVGGRKISFYGDLRGQGNDAINFCTDKKFIVQRWNTILD